MVKDSFQKILYTKKKKIDRSFIFFYDMRYDWKTISNLQPPTGESYKCFINMWIFSNIDDEIDF